ncbi:hypothetical protein [Rhodococcus ruber]|uniref:hypothetical protein n=1 Tax=Rhodococcus ruber TaxID=1830 RepID=UPI0007CD7C59|nr:hypothetical protein [Rhodococcus ruber]AWH00629.1 hypothetical protein DCN13_19720 [Rhodococcus ruber]
MTGLEPGGMFSPMVLWHAEIASPVLELDNRAIAALSIAGAVDRFGPELHASSVRAGATGAAATIANRAHMPEGT